MAESQLGTKAVVWGIGTTLSIAAATKDWEAQAETFASEAEESAIRNNKGQEVTNIFYNKRHTFTIECIPFGTTVANARTANNLPDPGTIVTLIDTEDTELAGTNAGKYILVRASKSKSNTDATRFSLELKQYTENDVAVALV